MPATSPTPKHDPTPALARDVIDLYEQALAGVQFPDLDLSALQTTRQELDHAQAEVERVERELAAAREVLEARVQALNAKAERALAYARIFAQDNSELSAQIAEIGRKKPGQLQDGGEPKKRGRKKKSDAPSDLFTERGAAEAEHGDTAAEAELEEENAEATHWGEAENAAEAARWAARAATDSATEVDAEAAPGVVDSAADADDAEAEADGRSLETRTEADADADGEAREATAGDERRPTRPQPTAAAQRRRSKSASRDRASAPEPD
jgi:hypothetical protein